MKNNKIHLVSLGCAKNLVDSESMSDILREGGFEFTSDPACANVIIINTCGFIESAKKEAIDKIFEMAQYKRTAGIEGVCDFLVVTGCLSQRYHSQMKEQMPEIDAILGTSEYNSINDIIKDLYQSDYYKNSTIGDLHNPIIKVNQDNTTSHLSFNRTPSTVGYAYLKVAEGCSNFCAYCAIPSIRGCFISRPVEDILQEACNLADKGFYEIVLIAQDTTRYGMDIYGRNVLPELINRISAIDKVRKIRILYCYADGITDELISVMRDNPKVAKYIEMPIQHADNAVLARMNRRDTRERIAEVIKQLRQSIPDIVIRTTVLVGFPGETVEEFNNLLSFIEEIKFDLLGCFVFSAEEGTPAYKMKPRIAKRVAEKRQSDIMISQKEISRLKNIGKLGFEMTVTIESIAPDGIFYMGRGDGQAPEIDPVVLVAATNEPLTIGDTYNIKIVDITEYELIGVTC
jgi:ribosomal protein S12 methylthiotransferase